MNEPFLVAVDMSELTDVVIRRAIDLATGRPIRIDLLNVVKPPNMVSRGVAAHQIYEQALKNKQAAALHAVQALMEKVPEPHRGNVLVRSGIPADEICDQAGEGYDMVILATKGLSGLQHTLLGSVAERVVRMAPIPVLVVR